MDNDAFKDLVRKRMNTGSSSKEIARKAVEAEFRKKKKRKRGGGYASSSDEEDDDDGRFKKNKHHGEENDGGEEDSGKAIQEELASRYRDRAKERRAGGEDVPSEGDNDNDKLVSLASTELLIVPHNKKGLDFSLVQKERQKLHKSVTFTKNNALEIDIRKKMPSMEEALEILRNFVDDSSSSSSLQPLSRGLAGYIRNFVEWKDDTIQNKFDTVSCGSTGKTLQNTTFSLAIDGDPSDSVKAWQKPRQSTLSDDEGAVFSFSSSSTMMTSERLDKVNRIFTSRKRMLSQMKQAAAASSHTEVNSSQSKTKETIINGIEDDDDDDIFGGLDDYVPPMPKKMN